MMVDIYSDRTILIQSLRFRSSRDHGSLFTAIRACCSGPAATILIQGLLFRSGGDHSDPGLFGLGGDRSAMIKGLLFGSGRDHCVLELAVLELAVEIRRATGCS